MTAGVFSNLFNSSQDQGFVWMNVYYKKSRIIWESKYDKGRVAHRR
jgi:hypothetical protein